MRTPLAWPTLSRLAHNQDERRVRAILRWRDLACPDRAPDASNDNDQSLDTRHGIRPTVGEIMRAIGCEPNGKAWSDACRRVEPTYSEPTATPVVDGSTVQLGALTFRDGALLSYGTPTGRTFKPGERHGPPKGATIQERSESSVHRYLALRGVTPEPGGLRRPISGAPTNSGQKDWVATTNRRMCRHLLMWLGADGRTSFDQARANAGLSKSDKGPDAIGGGDMWIGGITHGRGRGECSVGAVRMRESDDLERRIELAQLRDQLGHHAIVLDFAVSPASAEQIAIAHGYSASYAKKHGAALVDAAIDAFIALDAANENESKKIAA